MEVLSTLLTVGKGVTGETATSPKEYLIAHPPMIWLPFLENPSDGDHDIELERDPDLQYIDNGVKKR